jgi:hypothetical protein
VIIAIAAGILLAGIPGALVAVPFAAAANAVVQHLASETTVGEDPEKALETDYEDTGQRVETDADTGDAEDGVVGDTQDAGVADQFDADPNRSGPGQGRSDEERDG